MAIKLHDKSEFSNFATCSTTEQQCSVTEQTSKLANFAKTAYIGVKSYENRLRAFPKRENASLVLIQRKYRFFDQKMH